MDIAPSSRLKVDWLTDGLFGPYADAFNRHLTQRRLQHQPLPAIRLPVWLLAPTPIVDQPVYGLLE